MKTPATTNEAARLDALRRYEILDTPPEPAFDDLTSLAAYVCGAPIALVSLADEDRLWFKSRVGLRRPRRPEGSRFALSPYTIPICSSSPTP